MIDWRFQFLGRKTRVMSVSDRRWRSDFEESQERILRALNVIEGRQLRCLQHFFSLWANYSSAMRRDIPLQNNGSRGLKV